MENWCTTFNLIIKKLMKLGGYMVDSRILSVTQKSWRASLGCAFFGFGMPSLKMSNVIQPIPIATEVVMLIHLLRYLHKCNESIFIRFVILQGLKCAWVDFFEGYMNSLRISKKANMTITVSYRSEIGCP